ncbi:MAG: saccharopine dehydrogenase C-terminal domain-containing protein [Candidatus Caldarchaeum sp.]|uniref:Saccharopine dehydrogenase n=1 Tax=Caldiarchaeum subterraneum TaxID=311458 RepID=A0A7C4E3E3_CALS0|nr:saccharopine dehydrogenase NADP-binding domain-containing protein [Candidatus Caldarchaeales archaeon]MDJ0272488.1 saccharopine dehydrogenase NADP-binding domain-containing protein [Candidatus Caldarchaeales archaeon]
MRIAVLGGAGLTGQAAVRNLLENKKVSEVLVGDVNEKALERLSNMYGSGKLTTAKIDARSIEETAAFLRGCDVVINSVQYYYNLEVMQAALKAGVHYVDHGGLYHVTLKQLELDGLFKSKNLTALVGMGAQPGLTNLVAKHASEQLDEMRAVYIRDGSVDLTENPPLFTWSPLTLFDEMTLDAVVLRNGQLVSVPPLSLMERVEFPQPVGVLDTYVTIHSELATFPRSFHDKGLSECDWMEGSPDLLFVKKLADIGFASSSDIEIGGCRVSPRSFLLKLLESRGLVGYRGDQTPNDWEITRLIIHGKRLGKNVKLVYDILFPPKPEWRMSCAQTGVGIPSSTAAMMIAEGEIKQRGVIPPETCINPDEFLKKAETHGIKTTVKEYDA